MLVHWTKTLVILTHISSLLLFVHATSTDRDPTLDHEYDFIIVGGGTAGLTVADRITQAFPNRQSLMSLHSLHQLSKFVSRAGTVLVVEYGQIANSTPGEFEPPGSPPVAPNFTYQSLPISALNNRSASLVLGKTLGGSSAINGQFFDRGSRYDYDQWAALNAGSDGGIKWDWEGLLPYFRKASFPAWVPDNSRYKC